MQYECPIISVRLALLSIRAKVDSGTISRILENIMCNTSGGSANWHSRSPPMTSCDHRLVFSHDLSFSFGCPSISHFEGLDVYSSWTSC